MSLDEPFVGGHLVESHRTTRPQFLGADAYLCSKTELGSVGEARGGIHIHAGGIDLRLELLGGLGVLGDDTLAMAAAVGADMLDGSLESA